MKPMSRVKSYRVPSRGKMRWELRYDDEPRPLSREHVKQLLTALESAKTADEASELARRWSQQAPRRVIVRLKVTCAKKPVARIAEIEAHLANQHSAKYRLTERQAYDAEEAYEILESIGSEESLRDLAKAKKERWMIESKQRLAESPLVAEVVKQFLAETARRQAGKYHLKGYRERLNRFAESFRLQINRIGPKEVKQWLDGLTCKRHKSERPDEPITGRTWNNYFDALAALFKFAKGLKYVPADWDALAGLEKIKIRRRKITILTPDQMDRLLSACPSRLLPAIAISGFAGLRSEEVLRLTWREVDFAKGHIFLPEEITKTQTQRTVPISANLAEWLAPWREAAGQVCDYANLSEGKRNLARRLGLKWPKNGLRDSYISYRQAMIQDKPQVASEAGNSVSMIERHYLKLTTPDEAAKWFEIRPKSVTQNVLPLQFR